MDDMVLLPTEGVEEELTRVDVVPWLDRAKRGVLRGWFGTIGMVLGSPGRLGRALPANGGTMQAGWFALVTSLIYMALGCAIFVLPILFIGLSFGSASFSVLARLIGAAITVPMAMVIVLLLWTATTHGLLCATGKVAGGFSRTFSCLCYGSAANVLVAIPCLGGYMTPFSWIWWAIASGIILAVVHRVSGWRAQLAALLPPLAVLAAFTAVVFLSIVPNMSAAIRAASQRGASTAPTTVMKADFELQQYAMVTGAEPEHALRLLASGQLGLADLYEPGSLARSRFEVIGGEVVADVPGLTQEKTEKAIAAAKASLDSSGTHRLGDLVFVYRGVNQASGGNPDPSLWRVVWAPLNPSPNSPVIVIATVGGVISIPTPSWQASLAAQNTLRVSEGLPPIPDPFTVGLSPPVSAPNAPK